MEKVASHIRSIVDHDGAVILDMKADHFYTMNPVGAYIWTRLQNGQSLDQIAKALAEETGADIGSAYADINDFVSELKKKHLLTFPA